MVCSSLIREKSLITKSSHFLVDWAVVSSISVWAQHFLPVNAAEQTDLQVFPGEKSQKAQSCKISLLKGVLVLSGR